MERRAGWVTAAALAFLVIAWVVGSGPVPLLSDPPPSSAGPRPSPRPNPLLLTPTDPPSPRSLDAVTGGGIAPWVGGFVTIVVWALLVAGAALLLRGLWRRRWRRPHRATPATFQVLPSVAKALTDDADRHFAALEEGEPRNAIVACWLSLEESVRDAGLPRRPSETAAEFTQRVLLTLAVEPRMLAGFAELYREARFSAHPMDERARRGAQAALRSLHDDLAETAAATADCSDGTTVTQAVDR